MNDQQFYDFRLDLVDLANEQADVAITLEGLVDGEADDLRDDYQLVAKIAANQVRMNQISPEHAVQQVRSLIFE